MPSVGRKMEVALQLAGEVAENAGEGYELQSSTTTQRKPKSFVGTPIVLSFDGSFRFEVGTAGFHISKDNGQMLV